MANKRSEVEPQEGAQQTVQPPKKSDYTYVIKNRKARAATKHRKAITIVGIILLLLLLASGLTYGFFAAVEINNFKIFVETSGSKRLSLSPHSNMMPSSEMIELIGPDKMTNTTLAKGKNIAGSVPIEERLLDIISCEGSLTTVDDYYIAGTFYLQNVTDNEMLYGERISFTRATNGAQRALRVMLIKNNEITVYAAPKTDSEGNNIYLDGDGRRIYSDETGYYYENGEEKVYVEANGELQREEVVPLASIYTERKIATDENGNNYIEVTDSKDPWMAELFYDETFAVHNDNIIIAPGETVRYSVVIWFEGWDNDCNNSILGGDVELSLSFCCN